MDGDGVPRPTDCDDSDASVRVNAYYADSDQDGFGSEVMTRGCVLEEGYAERSGDCDDSDADINPLGSEVCDGADNDCDGLVDDDDEDAPLFVWYRDEDGDGAGDQEVSTEACAPPVGYVTGDVVDCDDTAATTHPGAPELCDGVDNDCDDTTSEDGVVTLDAAVNFSTIQEAVDAASEGSTVLVCDGTFTEALTMSSPMSLQSLNGAAVTTLDGGGLGATVLVLNPVEVVLSGFTITGGSGFAECGGGVFGAGGISLTVRDSIITGNQAGTGGGIYIELGDGKIGSSLTVEGSTISDNVADLGGGLALNGVVVELDEDSRVVGNESTDMAGGMFLSHDSSLTGGQFTGNGAVEGAGGVVAYGHNEIIGAVFEGNIADLGGGLMFVSSEDHGMSTAELHEVDILDNTASSNGGGLFSFSSEVELSGTHISGNAANQGGGMYLGDTTLTMDGATAISDNEAVSLGGGILLWGETTLRGGVVTENESPVVGAGGGVFFLSGDHQLTGVEIGGNAAVAGGGFYVHGSSHVVLDACVIEGNVASNRGGGGVVVDGTLVSASSDWGVGDEDNSPDDLVVVDGTTYLTYTTLGMSESFSCASDSGHCR